MTHQAEASHILDTLAQMLRALAKSGFGHNVMNLMRRPTTVNAGPLISLDDLSTHYRVHRAILAFMSTVLPAQYSMLYQ